MPITLVVQRERAPGENRVALVPDTARQFAGRGATLWLEANAGLPSHYADADYPEVSSGSTPPPADLTLCVTPPTPEQIDLLPVGSVLIGLLAPFSSRERLAQLNARKITAFALELLPRISRAQSMDALSSQGTVAGYQGALIAASLSPRFFPMLTTAAGTIRPAKALVIGAGVAGLQAIATCRRLGALVEAYDVRAAAREQIESLGARFVDTGVSADGSGGYARELSAEEKAQQQARLAKAVAAADVVICTAAIPGKPAPKIITADMVKAMKRGAAVIDLAAETGGNCAVTQPGETVVVDEVTIAGPLQLASRMPTHASEMYAKNLWNFLSPWVKDGALVFDWEDEIVAGTVLCKDGVTVHPTVQKILGDA